MDHPVIAWGYRYGDCRAGDSRAGIDRPHVRIEIAFAALRLVHGRDAALCESVDDAQIRTLEFLPDNAHGPLLATRC